MTSAPTPTPTETCDYTASHLADALRAREVTAEQIVESCLHRIEDVEDRVKAFLAPTAGLAREYVHRLVKRYGIKAANEP